jgi:phosphatidate cytidylyltransferase
MAGGLLGSIAGASLLLGAFGELRPGYVLAIALGAVAGDLVESMAKRQAGVKDAGVKETGAWLPGLGGLPDRADSLLLVLPIALVLAWPSRPGQMPPGGASGL